MLIGFFGLRSRDGGAFRCGVHLSRRHFPPVGNVYLSHGGEARHFWAPEVESKLTESNRCLSPIGSKEGRGREQAISGFPSAQVAR